MIASNYTLGEHLSEARKRKGRTLYEMSDELNLSKKERNSPHHRDIFMITMLLPTDNKLGRVDSKIRSVVEAGALDIRMPLKKNLNNVKSLLS